MAPGPPPAAHGKATPARFQLALVTEHVDAAITKDVGLKSPVQFDALKSAFFVASFLFLQAEFLSRL